MPDWTKARERATNATATIDANVFRGQSATHTALVEGVKVQRLSVAPANSSVPTSFAVSLDKEWNVDKSDLPLKLTWKQTSDARWEFKFDLRREARCYGLGERYSSLNLRGAMHTLSTTDTSLDQHESVDAMYIAIPFLIVQDGADAYGLFLDSPAPQRWDLDSGLINEGGIVLYSRRGWSLYGFGPAPLPSIVAAYTGLTGRHELPPLWSLGHQQSRWSYPDQETALAISEEFRRRNIPCDTIVLDIDYMDDYRVFTTSLERFPDFQAMVEQLNQNKFKVVTIVDPGVKKDSKYHVYQEGVKQDLFCKTSDGKLFVENVWPGKSVFPDFLQPETREWWSKHQGFLARLGVSGIWNDMNEPAFFNMRTPFDPQCPETPPDDQQPFMQTSPEGKVGHLEVRNLYGLLMSRSAREGLLKERPGERPFVLTRSGYAGVQKHSAIWLGDNSSWWEHLAKSIPMLLNVGLSGVAFAGADIGGFGANTSAELLTRWYELGIFYPFFRNHCIMGGCPQEPWAFGPRTEEHIRKLIAARYSLLPYIQNLFWEHKRCGAPLLRPLDWHYPQDENVFQIDDQFLFGESILVAPILHRSHTHRYVYFPEGQWYSLENNRRYAGGTVQRIRLELGTVPAFVKEGSIIPCLDPVQSTAEAPQAPITFRVFGCDAKGKLFEDDGISLNSEYSEYDLLCTNSEFQMHKVYDKYNSSRRYFVQIDGRKTEYRLT